ncbi:2-hydroxychromene-2-carboxylate isomerase [Piscinibacter sakaiensis]|uniref:2-hydroxychromene-2-carboxylate isomerase n=1 Tax=Piscinibacter sakaiensis TaxID=1547922 RepID=A0A0K8P5Q5_PISS1|nr:2-hydroxychromene-2-carboxylate isomerase [Piscinibacter sakaiensis]GAP37922.1 2-hydroxychromene-2-carboxylate isomerase [Piscinibacter sakaiensis]
MTAPEIEFFFDCSSPWTYLAFHNVQPLAERFGASLRWRPFMVGGVFNTVNPSVYASREQGVPAKSAYARKSLLDWARLSGLDLRHPKPAVFPVNSVKIMRACLVLEPEGRLPAFARAAFEAYFRDDVDISRDEGVRTVCNSAGVPADELLQAIAGPAVKAALHANTAELIVRGGFGSPTMFVDRDDMYFGNDNLPLVEAALRRRQRAHDEAAGRGQSFTDERG